MKYEGLLPIGSVVLLKNSTRKLMVIGYGQEKLNDASMLYDYAGCLFPEGFSSPDSTFLFNGTQVAQVYSLGYIDEQAMEYIARMEMAIKQVREERKQSSGQE